METILTEKKNTSKLNTKTMALISVMTAVICILGPLSLAIPISPVPISLGTFAIYLTGYVLGMRKGTISCLIYLLIGFVGIPVFTAFSGGPAKLLGPTGGYLVGYIFLILICGFASDRTNKILLCFLGMILGTAVLYLFGTIWLAYQASMTFGEALMAGVIPFIPGDFAKIVIVLIVGPQIKKQLKRAKLM